MGYDPTFSTSIDDIGRNNTVYVESMNAFPDPVGGVITLTNNTVYTFSKPINSGTTQFKIPDSGEVVINTTNTLVNDWTTELDNLPLIIGDLQRLVINDVNVTNTTNTATFIDTEVVTAPRSVVILQQMFIIGFGSIGTIDGSVSICDSVVFQNCQQGIVLNDNGAAFGSGILWEETNFINQVGDHITCTGNTNFISFDAVGGTPQTGDQLFNVDGVTVASTFDVISTVFSSALGGTLGLTKTYTSDQELDNKFRDIMVDTSSNPVEIELPDSDAFTLQQNYEIVITDLGNAATNNITIIPNANDSTTIQGLDRYVIIEDNQSIILRLVDGQWLKVTDVFYQARRDFVTANNQISRTSSSFTDALQKNFAVVEQGVYKLGYVYQWRHEKKDQQHRVRVRVDGVENTDLRARQYMGGQDDVGSVRMVTSGWTLVNLTEGVYDIDFQYSSQSERAYLYYRRLYLEKWSQ